MFANFEILDVIRDKAAIRWFLDCALPRGSDIFFMNLRAGSDIFFMYLRGEGQHFLQSFIKAKDYLNLHHHMTKKAFLAS